MYFKLKIGIYGHNYHDPQATWPEFERRYEAELKGSPALAQLQQAIAGKPVVTLLYSSRDEQHNNAIVLRNMLQHQ